MAQPKSQRVNLRIAASDDALLRHAASAADESLSEFLVKSARLRAELLLADRTHFELSDHDWKLFTAEIERPARVIPEVVELLRRPRPR